MIFSKHTIFSQIKDSNNYYIVNLLNGSADILDSTEGIALKGYLAGGEIQPELYANLVDQGYFVDEKEEQKKFQNKYLDFVDSRDDEEIQLIFAPNYSCNFTCTYCFQDEYENEKQALTNEVVDAFFEYINKEFAGRRKYITIFGGEPLLNSSKQKSIIQYMLQKADENRLEVCVVTNGYALAEYIDILKKSQIREIQVTLDGNGPVHDKRRFLKGGGNTFDKIVNGIDLCLENNIPINLRMVVDKENIASLPALAEIAINKGWTSNELFKTHLGRNYELHHCQADSNTLFSRISLYESLFELIKTHPHILEFHKPAFSVTKFLFENGELPNPLFDSCPACKSEWAFDYTGHVYSCTATVGKNSESLGTFFPLVSKNMDKILEWENRDVTTISDCADCSLQLACGGGCGTIAKNRTGLICSTDCRPVKELLEIGFAAYFETAHNKSISI